MTRHMYSSGAPAVMQSYRRTTFGWARPLRMLTSESISRRLLAFASRFLCILLTATCRDGCSSVTESMHTECPTGKGEGGGRGDEHDGMPCKPTKQNPAAGKYTPPPAKQSTARERARNGLTLPRSRFNFTRPFPPLTPPNAASKLQENYNTVTDMPAGVPQPYCGPRRRPQKSRGQSGDPGHRRSCQRKSTARQPRNGREAEAPCRGDVSYAGHPRITGACQPRVSRALYYRERSSWLARLATGLGTFAPLQTAASTL